jgi:hypothetical protein
MEGVIIADDAVFEDRSAAPDFDASAEERCRIACDSAAVNNCVAVPAE